MQSVVIDRQVFLNGGSKSRLEKPVVAHARRGKAQVRIAFPEQAPVAMSVSQVTRCDMLICEICRF